MAKMLSQYSLAMMHRYDIQVSRGMFLYSTRQGLFHWPIALALYENISPGTCPVKTRFNELAWTRIV